MRPNRCGECAGCCTLFPIEPIGKPINSKCPHCIDGGGCDIYDEKPQVCTDYNCAYIQGKNIPQSLRPDKCGIIFTKKTDNIFTGAVMPDMIITDFAKQQINAFNGQGYSVILITPNDSNIRVILAKNHTLEAIEKEHKEAISGNLQY